ncbi:hypothetical protein GCM10028799_03220 [Kribbella italica]
MLGSIPFDLSDEIADDDLETGFLRDLAGHGGRVVLTRFDPAARQRPQPAAGLVGPLDEQQTVLVVVHQGSDTVDPVTLHVDNSKERGAVRIASVPRLVQN